jgi:hypothetical protein
MTTLICKIPPNLPLLKGEITPLWQRGAWGDLPIFVSIQFLDLYKSHKGSIFSFEMKYPYGKSQKQHFRKKSLLENPCT